MTATDLANALPRVFFLRNVDDETRASFAQLVGCRNYPKHNILFHHGDPSHVVYIVVSGQVKVSLITEGGREVVLSIMGAGGVCGLIGALDDGVQTGTGVTVTSARIATVPRDHFMAWLAQRPALHQNLVLELAHMLRNAYEKVGEQALLPVKRRLLATLVQIAREEGAPQDGGEVVFTRPTHQELADRVGTTRVVVSRALKELISEDESIAGQGRVLRVRVHALISHDDF